jgi:very-short-patch-repair endonuclease
MARYPSLQKTRARKLRKNLTDVENKLWSRLRGRQLSGVKFRRQYPIGPFIVDFCCVERRLVVELDGGQHAERNTADERRTRLVERFGYRVLRFWDNEVLSNFDGVLERINEVLEGPRPLPSEWARE